MTIEQTLMRTVGGLTQGKGMANSVNNKFILGMHVLYNICNNIE